jgi:biotin carboxyl carrier protein
MTYDVAIDGERYRLELNRTDNGWHCRLNGLELNIDAVLVRPDVLSILVDGRTYEVRRDHAGAGLHLYIGARRYAAELYDPRSFRGRKDSARFETGARKLVAPMPGKIVRILAREQMAVEVGQGVVVVEAMKMQNEIKSPKHGTVKSLSVKEGAAVNAGDVLAIVE